MGGIAKVTSGNLTVPMPVASRVFIFDWSNQTKNQHVIVRNSSKISPCDCGTAYNPVL